MSSSISLKTEINLQFLRRPRVAHVLSCTRVAFGVYWPVLFWVWMGCLVLVPFVEIGFYRKALLGRA